MRVFLAAFAILLFALSVSVFAQEQASDSDECQVSYLFNAWARPTTGERPTSAVYGQLVNIGVMHDTLIAARTDAAEIAELHEMVVGEDNVMRMRQVEGGFVVPPNSFLELRPGGLHIMLINPTRTLMETESIEVTLVFERAGEVQITVPIRSEDGMTMHAEMDNMAMHAGSEEPMMPTNYFGERCAAVYFLDPWVRASVPGAPNSAAFGLLVNLSDTEDALVAVDTEISHVAELHEMVMGSGDVMQMREIEGGITIPERGAALLRPGGLHIMLINLNEPLAPGDEIAFTLSFMQSDEVTLVAPVREVQAQGTMPNSAPMTGHGS